MPMQAVERVCSLYHSIVSVRYPGASLLGCSSPRRQGVRTKNATRTIRNAKDSDLVPRDVAIADPAIRHPSAPSPSGLRLYGLIRELSGSKHVEVEDISLPEDISPLTSRHNVSVY